jgi:drug/metabolite transporter (DMT)-like permease
MKLSDQPKGYIFAFIATISMANVYVFSKAALLELNLYQFGFYWFGFAILWNVIYGIPAGKIEVARALRVNDFKILIVLGILELIGTTLFFMSIEVTTDPAIMSFLQNLVPLFVIIMGVSLLGERFSGIQIVGVILTLTGAAITSFSGGKSGSGVFVPGTLLMIASTLFLATTTIISKKYIKRIDPGLLSLNRSLYLFAFAAILMVVNGEKFIISNRALVNTVIGSILGPFLTALSTYSALKYIEASKSTIIQSSKGLFVTLGAWLYFSTIPKSFQVIGGILTIIGVVVLITAKEKVIKKGEKTHPYLNH